MAGGLVWHDYWPPFTSMVAQVMNEAASLTRNSTSEAISSGSPERPQQGAEASRAHGYLRHWCGDSQCRRSSGEWLRSCPARPPSQKLIRM